MEGRRAAAGEPDLAAMEKGRGTVMPPSNARSPARAADKTGKAEWKLDKIPSPPTFHFWPPVATALCIAQNLDECIGSQVCRFGIEKRMERHCLLLLTTATVVAARPWFFVPLSVGTRYPNGVGGPYKQHQVTSWSSVPGGEEGGVGVDSWAFVGSRSDPADLMQNRYECNMSGSFVNQG